MDVMNPTIKARWLTELRSGKYRQTMGTLRSDDDAYCCLGVLCNTIDPRDWIEREDIYGAALPGWLYRHGTKRNGEILPGDLRSEVGIPDDVEDTLTVMNDNGKSFAEIADWIEANL